MADYTERCEQLRQHSQELISYKLGAEFADAVNDAADTIEKLQAELRVYKDAEEQGRLVVLPCATHEWVLAELPPYRAHKTMFLAKSDILLSIEQGYVISEYREAAEAKLKELEGTV